MSHSPVSDTMSRLPRASPRATAGKRLPERLWLEENRGRPRRSPRSRPARIAWPSVGLTVRSRARLAPGCRVRRLASGNRSRRTTCGEAAGRRPVEYPVWFDSLGRLIATAPRRCGPGSASSPGSRRVHPRRDCVIASGGETAPSGPPGWVARLEEPSCVNAKLMPPRRLRRSRTQHCPYNPAGANYVQLTSVQSLRMHLRSTDFGPASRLTVACHLRRIDPVDLTHRGPGQRPGGREP